MQVQDDKQLEELYRITMPKVARMAHRMNGNLDMARDILHDAIIIYLEKQQQHTLPELHAASAYITGIARILCIRQLRQKGYDLPLESVSAHIIPENYFDPPPVRPGLLQYLQSAGKRCMELLKAFYYEEQSISDIAATFRFKSLHSASVQKYKCLEKVRDHIKQSDYAETVD
ncbi:DNA-directed RNA polymerase specialized sigma24 family protein [Chitinophaga dinghuensis]|uniref:DNA-directed RNA polymerase specialized sigma24 family protein n=1 Tax=Chitinophaga dinghuensis TaxID=1539050 RepID=A0A327VHZ7_9BACT|nr:sigma-70 family RNA polymerase sigma factor [Chitinophaga dinghuensis]RAJ73702.1 DNA-directed RNA polymerase specialized sigma24 family protein [Chitinophaga dinghuensis]